MKRSTRVKALAALPAVAACLAVAPTAAAASAGTAAPTCVTDSATKTFGRGEISICIENGRARVTGWVEDLKPGGWVDGECVAWYMTWQTAAGDDWSFAPVACGHAGGAYVTFDYDPSDWSQGPQGITGVKNVSLGLFDA
ncbi:hypothetical protein [Streptomyces indiaensis]|uniref:Secreted protein n=1 Tax=Streptomyces indiaensis TaxID=284033 RepID=A0ABN3DHU5_9ACTN|nr:hypothetical protein [Streptomyces indiaensis]MCF1644145.1 hypothetical protein [Streptomyces indiaensis]